VKTSATRHSTLQLYMALSLLRASHTRVLIFIQALLWLLIVALLLWLITTAADEQHTRSQVLQKFTTAALSAYTGSLPDRLLGVGLLAGLLLSFNMLWQQSHARLRVGIDGIHASMPGWLGWPIFKQTGGDWQLRWRDIVSARLEAPKHTRRTSQGLRFYRLVIKTGKDEIRINPYVWFNPAGTDHRMGFRELFGNGASNVQRIQDAPLIQLLQARGIEIAAMDSEPGKAASEAFQLGSHKGLGLQVVLLFVFGGYFAVDHFMLAPYQALQPIPKLPFLLLAMAALALIAISGRGAPKLERGAVGIMLLVAMLAALYPAMLRYNALDAEVINATYEASTSGHYTALNKDLPDIDMSRHRGDEYWQQYEAGSLHEFTVLRGQGGFYQLHMTPLNRKIRAWYDTPQ